MENQKLYRGRLIDHIHLVVEDLEASFKFYSAIAQALNIPVGKKAEHFFYIDELFISDKNESASGKLTGRTHLAFQAQDRSTVDRVFKAGVEAGGKDNGKPGERPYHPGYYACFWLDPDGNNIEVVFHGDAKRSTAAIEITF